MNFKHKLLPCEASVQFWMGRSPHLAFCFVVRQQSHIKAAYQTPVPISFPIDSNNLYTMATATTTNRNPIARYVGGAALVGVAALALIYHDRAVFDEHREDIKTQPGWPLVGNLPILLQWKDRIHEFLLEGFTSLDETTLWVSIRHAEDLRIYIKNFLIRTMSALGIPRHISTIDPRNVEHVLKGKQD